MIEDMINSVETKNTKRYGPAGYRRVFFDNWVQQSLNKTRDKRFTNQYGDNSLDGLVIDWHMAEYDVPAGVSTAPALDAGQDYQPTYSYAA